MKILGRPLEFDPDTAIEVATEVFWRNGFEATSLNNLTETMQISKSSLYQSFGNKKLLFETCLEGYSAMLITQIERELEEATSGMAFFENLLESIGSTANHQEGTKGCLIVNTVNELGQSDAEISILVNQKLDAISTLFIRAIERAKFEGEISSDSNPRVIAAYLHVAISGLRTMIKAGEDTASINQVILMILKAIK